MPSKLVKPANELSPASLLVLCDLAEAPKGRRRDERIWTLLRPNVSRGPSAPLAVRALIDAGFAELRSKTGTWSLEITDRGMTLHRHLMTELRRVATPQS